MTKFNLGCKSVSIFIIISNNRISTGDKQININMTSHFNIGQKNFINKEYQYNITMIWLIELRAAVWT
uniref:Uncharacterized protein n=1 Tax=Oryza meridionalis TaxID=40149 RepID=A0A0E0EPG2_9ORYZ